MGGTDELGSKFPADRVLYRKQPINFSLENPTPPRFLDPIFCAHNDAIKLLPALAPGYYPFPHQNSTYWIEKWLALKE